MIKKQIIKGFCTIGLILAVIGSNAQNKIIAFSLENKNAKQYEKAEWKIDVVADFDNPYFQEDISIDMELKSPSGKRLNLPCYYEFGNSRKSTWRARFMAQEKGKYSYTFHLKKNEKVAFSTGSKTFNVSGSKMKGILHAASNWTFRFDNGEAFRGIGENICWESRADDDSKFFKALHENPKYNYEYMLPALSSHGGNYFRTWICSWNLPLDWKSGINNKRYTNSSAYFNPSAIAKMDRLVNLSDSLGLYMMLTLGPGAYDSKNGRYQVSTAEFFKDPKAKKQYYNRLRFIVARWGYSSAIGAWEFFNEIDNVQFRDKNNPIPAEDIVQWHSEMAEYLKKIDPFDHLITTSISHRDLKGLNNIDNIDFNQKHIYKNNRALPTTIVNYTRQFGKPYVIGEYGYEYDWSKNFDLFAQEMDSDFKRGLWYGLFSPTPVLPLSWWWEYFDNRGTDAYIRKVRTIQDRMMKAGKGNFDTFSATSSNAEVECYSVKCGEEYYIYLYNPKKEKHITKINLPLISSLYSAERYDCESGIFSALDNVTSIADNSQIVTAVLDPGTDAVYILKNK
ncbi:DUF5060 domain-containing protein [Pedobacter agri]|uniref:DUF5060 domain-containing protein n=1 Tax=Pedobacter agri TaxID=454586 RepID=UPI0027894767|nr:DUF5060 domain-containing protein [Pedobacter agri]MDQ1142724.1 hypothetical protein [Pedobacter agri]